MDQALTTAYNAELVILSIAIAILASYTTLDLAGRVNATQNRAQIGWIVSGATAMGVGIWSMHFIGMLAFRLPVRVAYDFVTVLGSMVPAIVASGLALFLVSRPTLGWLQLLGGSLLMGLGIATMHYVGMAAMQTSAMMHYTPWMVGLSILVAIAVSFTGLFLAFQLREETTPHQTWKKPLAAIVMGTAIPTMHYTGMAAAHFTADANTVLAATVQPPDNIVSLVAAVSIGTLIVSGLALLTAFFERRLSAQVIYAQVLQESQESLQAILEGVKVGVLVLGDDTEVQISNHAALELLNLSSSKAVQKFWDQVSEKDESINYFDSANPLLFQSLQPVLKKIAAGESVQNTVIYSSQPGQQEPKALLFNAVPLCLSKATKPQIVCTFSEVTELKRTESRLKESEAKFRELATQEELLNRLSGQIRQSLELPVILQTAVSEVRTLFETDRAVIYQFNDDWRGQVIIEDVTSPWQPTLGEAADDCFPGKCLDHYKSGGIKAINSIQAAGLDPNHLKFLQRLQVQANLIVPIMVCDQLWGLLIVHQCSGPRVWQEKEGHLLYQLATQLGIAIQQSNLYARAEQNALKAQAEAQKLSASEAQLKQQAQNLQQAIQELKSLQIQLVQSEKMSSLGQLVAGVAHEINNPVNFIHGNLSYVETYAQDLLSLVHLYQKQYPNPDPKIQKKTRAIDLEFLEADLDKVLESMKIGTDRIRQIVLSLRNFSRMDEADFKQVDIHGGIDSTLMILQHRLKARPDRLAIEITRDYGDLPLVACYPGQLNQVFMNLVTNAIDSLEEAQEAQISPDAEERVGHITIRTTQVDHQWVEIRIADNGPGVPEAVRKRMFDPFFTTKPTGKGTGMGLSISYQIIVEKHRGHIACHSTPGQGTEFSIQIPIDQT